MTLKSYCEKNGLDEGKVTNLVFGACEGILPKARGFTGYIGEITDTSLICVNDHFEVKKEIPFASFGAAEFGIGSGNLWLQCLVDGKPFVFTMPRRDWKKPAAKLLLEKISEVTEVQGKKDYDRIMGKLFWLHLFLH